MSLKMVAGLGNPGRRYRWTRHNLGFRVVAALAEESGVNLKKKRKLSARIGQGMVDSVPLLLVQPETFVNASGPAVRKVMEYFGIELSGLLVITDDVDLPPGSIRIRRRGGAGGHRGLGSIIGALGDNGFARLRLGIGGKELSDLTGHVLSPASGEEEASFRQAIDQAVAAVKVIFRQGIESAMNDYNRVIGSDNRK